jgi:hypothetical protein
MEIFEIEKILGFSHNTRESVAKAKKWAVLHCPPSKDGGK